MRKWAERVATVIVLLIAVGLLLACWMPAYVGAGDRPHRPARLNR